MSIESDRADKKIATIKEAIESQVNEAIRSLDKYRVDMVDISEALLRLNNIKERLPGLMEAIDEATAVAYNDGCNDGGL